MCQWERCVYCRLNSDVIKIEAEISDAHQYACKLCSTGMNMGNAANKALSASRRQALRKKLDKLPVVAQANQCQPLEMELMIHI